MPSPPGRPAPFRAGLQQEDDTELGPEEEHKLARWGLGRRGKACKAKAPKEPGSREHLRGHCGGEARPHQVSTEGWRRAGTN